MRVCALPDCDRRAFYEGDEESLCLRHLNAVDSPVEAAVSLPDGPEAVDPSEGVADA